MPGALTGVPSPLGRGGPDADDPPQGSHHPGCPRRDCAIREPTGVLAQRYSVSTETIRKWRKRGPADCQDHSSRPHKLPWKATEEERAIVCALRRATGFPLDDLTFVVTHFLPHLNRDAVYRILKAEGLGRLPPASRSRKPNGTFKDYDLGFIHVDVKHLPKLRTADGESRKRYLYVAIDRASRFVHLAVKDDETERSAVAFLKEAVRAFPFQVTHVLTDRGSCFTADGFEAACQKLGVAHRKTRPYTPKTNGMVERFNGRIQREVLGITVASHRDLETLLHGFNRAYNARRQRVLKGRSPEMVVRERLSAMPDRANSQSRPAVRSLQPAQSPSGDRSGQGRLASRQLRGSTLPRCSLIGAVANDVGIDCGAFSGGVKVSAQAARSMGGSVGFSASVGQPSTFLIVSGPKRAAPRTAWRLFPPRAGRSEF